MRVYAKNQQIQYDVYHKRDQGFQRFLLAQLGRDSKTHLYTTLEVYLQIIRNIHSDFLRTPFLAPILQKLYSLVSDKLPCIKSFFLSLIEYVAFTEGSTEKFLDLFRKQNILVPDLLLQLMSGCQEVDACAQYIYGVGQNLRNVFVFSEGFFLFYDVFQRGLNYSQQGISHDSFTIYYKLLESLRKSLARVLENKLDL